MPRRPLVVCYLVPLFGATLPTSCSNDTTGGGGGVDSASTSASDATYAAEEGGSVTSDDSGGLVADAADVLSDTGPSWPETLGAPEVGADVFGNLDGSPDGATPPPSRRVAPPFVAVGYGTIRAFSSDGKAWTRAPDPTTLPSGWTGPPVSGDNQWLLRGGCFGQGRFLAVGGTGGDQGLMLSSADGKAWSLVGGAQANDDCAFGNDVWVTGTRWSRDGMRWMVAGEGASTREMVFGNGTFVAVGDNGGGEVSYAKDGTVWAHLPITFKGTNDNRKGYNQVTFGNGLFLAVHNYFQSSPIFTWDAKDPTTFKETPRAEFLGQDTEINAVAYGRGSFVVATPGYLFIRKDGATAWTKVAYSGTGALYNLVVTDDLFLTDQAWSSDGVVWTKATNPPNDGINKIIGVSSP